jgi:hypothetical protein
MIPDRETLTIFLMLFIVAAGYLYVGDDDYHKKFDNVTTIRYNCDMLIGSWHPDVPPQVIKECRDKNRRSVIVKIYKE